MIDFLSINFDCIKRIKIYKMNIKIDFIFISKMCDNHQSLKGQIRRYDWLKYRKATVPGDEASFQKCH